MEIKKIRFVLFMLFFLGVIAFMYAGIDESDNNPVSGTGSSTNSPADVAASEAPIKLSGKDGDLFFIRQLYWDKAEYAVRYTVTLEQKSDNLDAYIEVLRKNTEQTSIDITVPPGEYRFQVSSINILGMLDTQSDWNYFTVRNPITLMEPGSGAAFSNNPVSPSPVVWVTELPLQNSRVIFSRDPEPAKDPNAIIQYVAQGVNTISMPALGEGIWYWTVFGETPDGISVSAASPLWFRLLSLPLLSSPHYVRPGHDEVITLNQLMAERKITFEWEQVPDANAYIFSLYGYSGKPVLLAFSSPSPATSYVLTDLTILNMDSYFWQVEAVTASRNGTVERRGIIQQQAFEIQVQRSDSLRATNLGTIYGF
ncbi:MAG: hypothetical protein FWD78_11720 [Treponema sp.]|nr:hypothetical protein [Treponema sp.]